MTPAAKDSIISEFNELVNFGDILDDMIVAIAENLKPEDVFDESQLAEWAEENGFKKEN